MKSVSTLLLGLIFILGCISPNEKGVWQTQEIAEQANGITKKVIKQTPMKSCSNCHYWQVADITISTLDHKIFDFRIKDYETYLAIIPDSLVTIALPGESEIVLLKDSSDWEIIRSDFPKFKEKDLEELDKIESFLKSIKNDIGFESF